MIAFLEAATSLPGTIAERKRADDQSSNLYLGARFFVAESLRTLWNSIRAPSFQCIISGSVLRKLAFHWHASCHLPMRRATLSASMLLGAMRCSTEQRRDATRRDASRCAIRLHGMRTDGILDAMRGPSIFVWHWNPRRILSSASPNVPRERSRSEYENEYVRAMVVRKSPESSVEPGRYFSFSYC